MVNVKESSTKPTNLFVILDRWREWKNSDATFRLLPAVNERGEFQGQVTITSYRPHGSAQNRRELDLDLRNVLPQQQPERVGLPGIGLFDRKFRNRFLQLRGNRAERCIAGGERCLPVVQRQIDKIDVDDKRGKSRTNRLIAVPPFSAKKSCFATTGSARTSSWSRPK